jgi:hypothetical protein
MDNTRIQEHSGSSKTIGRGDKLAAGLMYLSAVALAVAEIIWLLHTASVFSTPLMDQHHTYSNIQPGHAGGYTSFLRHSDRDSDRGAELLLQLNHVSAGDQTASVTLTLDLPATLLNGVVDTGSKENVVDCSPVPTICTAIGADQLLIGGFITDPAGIGGLVRMNPVPIPLDTLQSVHTGPPSTVTLANTRFISGSVPVSLPLDGNSALYPLDWYEFSANLNLYLTSSLEFADSTLPNFILLPVDIISDEGMSDFTVVAAQSNPTAVSGPDLVSIVIVRSSVTRLYILSIALIPLMLALVLGHFIAVRRTEDAVKKPEVMAALAAFLFAVLPLRIVLVPPDLLELTYVDTLLGVGVVALLTILLLEYARSVWPVPVNHAMRFVAWLLRR